MLTLPEKKKDFLTPGKETRNVNVCSQEVAWHLPQTNQTSNA